MATDELLVLSSATADDFVVDRLLGVGHSGMVVSARCRRVGRDKLYAVKLLFNFTSDYSSVVSNSYENEWLLLSRILPHQHIVRYWVQFISTIPDSFIQLAPPDISKQAYRSTAGGGRVRRKAQFLVLDYHPATLQAVLSRNTTLITPAQVLLYGHQLLTAVDYLYREYRMCHLDIKLSNLLVSSQGHLLLCDFGSAVQFTDERFHMQWRQGMSIGGNRAHLAPEVLSAHYQCRASDRGAGVIDYSKQPSFAVGVLLYEIATGEHPLPDYPLGWSVHGGQVTYSPSDIPALPNCYPESVCSLVAGLLHPDPTQRLQIVNAKELIAGEVLEPLHSGGVSVNQDIDFVRAQLVVLAAERDFAVHEMRAMADHCQTVATEFEQLAQHCEALKQELTEARRECKAAVTASEAAFEASESLQIKLKLMMKERDLAKSQVEELRDIASGLQSNHTIRECLNCHSFFLLDKNMDESCCLHTGKFLFNRWSCCYKTDPQAAGCITSSHVC